jgi:ribonucleases P/MRP protein subunit RPP40
MLHGKKGFERLIWAAKNVLNRQLTWLFVDVKSSYEIKGQYRIHALNESMTTADILSGPIEQHKPEVTKVGPVHQEILAGAVPLIDRAETIADAMYEEQLLEWLGLVLLKSPRIALHDNVDPYLCRYELPEAAESKENNNSPDTSQKLHHLQWKGLISSRFVTTLLLEMKKDLEKGWFGLNVSAFGGVSYTLLCLEGSEALFWDIEEGS